MHRPYFHGEYTDMVLQDVGYHYIHDFGKYKDKGFKLSRMDEVEAIRVANPCSRLLGLWYRSFLEYKKQFKYHCILGADEMGVELSDCKLDFLTKRGKNLTVAADQNFSHTTVSPIERQNMGGAAFPPFVIIQSNTETSDLRDLHRIEGLSIAINPSGWMN